MNYYRCVKSGGGSGEDYSSTYTGSIDGQRVSYATLAGYYYEDNPSFNNIKALVIGANVNNVAYMFLNCNNIPSDIYFKQDNIFLSTSSLISGTNNSKRKNLHFRPSMNKSFNGFSQNICGKRITWTAMTNGFYNAAYNVYCYYNYSG